MRLLMQVPAREGTRLAALHTSSSWPRARPNREAGCSVSWVSHGSLGPGEVPNLSPGLHPSQTNPRATMSSNSPSHPIPVFRERGGGSSRSHIHLRQRWIRLGGVRLKVRTFVGLDVGASCRPLIGRHPRCPRGPQGLRVRREGAAPGMGAQQGALTLWLLPEPFGEKEAGRSPNPYCCLPGREPTTHS